MFLQYLRPQLISPRSRTQCWRSIRISDFLRRPRNFLYLAMHEGYKVGKFWTRIPDFHDWGMCQFCNETESMQHILFECRRPGQAELWSLAQLLWEKKRQQWPQMSMGLALGCGLAKFYDDNGRLQLGTTRLFRILVAETMHTIWKIRCKIALNQNNVPMVRAQIHNIWVQVMNERLKNDCLMTNQARYGKRALNSDLVLRTWSGTLRDENSLPDSWIMEPKGFIGYRANYATPTQQTPPGPPGRNR
ncbi:hypothetical protein C8J56DRAFT_802209 [Mycena floridula]|nr:hypothetical protein C8J56DRAFT_802209 [Mycena floridula]